jgi:hypothetical protein
MKPKTHKIQFVRRQRDALDWSNSTKKKNLATAGVVRDNAVTVQVKVFLRQLAEG